MKRKRSVRIGKEQELLVMVEQFIVDEDGGKFSLCSSRQRCGQLRLDSDKREREATI